MKVRLSLRELQLGNKKMQDELAEEAIVELANYPEKYGLMKSDEPDDFTHPSFRSIVVESADRETAMNAIKAAIQKTHGTRGVRCGYRQRERNDALDRYLGITEGQIVAEELPPENDSQPYTRDRVT